MFTSILEASINGAATVLAAALAAWIVTRKGNKKDE